MGIQLETCTGREMRPRYERRPRRMYPFNRESSEHAGSATARVPGPMSTWFWSNEPAGTAGSTLFEEQPFRTSDFQPFQAWAR